MEGCTVAHGEYILGYTCPHCGPVEGSETDRDAHTRVVWTFRRPVTEGFEIRCERCGRDVPRAHWEFTPSHEGQSGDALREHL